VHLVGFLIRVYHDARSLEHHIWFLNWIIIPFLNS